MPRNRPRRRGPVRGAGPARPAVLIDTNIWVAYDRGQDGALRRLVARLQRDGRAAFIPPVLVEFARGLDLRGPAFEYEFARFEADFLCVPLAPEDWAAAVRLARQAPPARRTIQLADLLLAVVAARTGFPVWSNDPDLDRLNAIDPRVTLFQP